MVLLLVQEKKEILPRYFLNLPEGASEVAIEKAYQRTVKRWEPLTKSTKECMKKLGTSMLHMVKQAYLALRGEENSFLLEMNNQYPHYLPWFVVVFDDHEQRHQAHGHCGILDDPYGNQDEVLNSNIFE